MDRRMCVCCGLLVLLAPEAATSRLQPDVQLGEPPPAPETVIRPPSVVRRPLSLPWLDVSNRETIRESYFNMLAAISGLSMGWTGNITTGDPGTISDAYRTAALTHLNWYRAMAGVPGLGPWNTALYSQEQQCALMMSANSQLSHSPPSSWLFYTAAGAAGAGSSNICLGCQSSTDPGAIGDYILDPGAGNEPAGHRRWLLYPQSQNLSTGSVDDTATSLDGNCTVAYDSNYGTARPTTRDPFVAWPPNGFIPSPELPYTWSFAVGDADFSSATVTVNTGPPCAADSIPVTQYPIVQGYGENAITFLPSQNIPPDCNTALNQAGTNDITYLVSINNVSGQNYSYTVTSFDPTQGPPLPNISAVTNAASYNYEAAPGSLVAIFGSNLAASTASATSIPLPLSLGGVTATVNTVPVPLLYVSPTQINAQLPYETAAGAVTLLTSGNATLGISVNGAPAWPQQFQVYPAVPGIFVYDTNRAIAVNPDGNLNGPADPAKPGDTLVVYMTGQGAVTNQPADGNAALANPLSWTVATTTATVGGANAPVSFSGLTPTLVGMMQVDLTVPSVSGGNQPLVVTVGGVVSNQAEIAVSAPQ